MKEIIYMNECKKRREFLPVNEDKTNCFLQ